MQIIDTVPTLSQAKSISCRQFAHMQPSYVSQKHLLRSVCTLAARLRRAKTFASVSLYTCSPLTSGKSICFSQFVHLQPAYVGQKHLLQSVCTLAARLRRAKPFASVSLYTCSPLTSGKSICFSQFVHLQPAYVGQNHLLQSVCTLAARLRRAKPFASVSLYTCSPLTSGKSICFSQFVHLQPAYVGQKHLLQSVCTLAARLRRAKAFASVSLYTCSPLTSGKSICFSQFVHLQPAYVGQNRFVQARPLSPWKKRHTAGKLNINLSLQC